MGKLNIVSHSDDWRAQLLSNFAETPFVLGGIRFASVEGFVQAIKFKPGDPRREQTFAMVGMAAKRMSRKAEKDYGRRSVWWGMETIAYGSWRHRQLIAEAITAKVLQNPDVAEALIATEGLELEHDLGHPESATTSLPAEVFVKVLTEIRSWLISEADRERD